MCPFAGLRKRDNFSSPVSSEQPWQIEYLREAADYFRHWRDSKRVGLTSQTFTAFVQTTSALADLCEHLLFKDQTSFRFIMLGKCQSDPIEGRFGRYRQLCGANFYLSVRQIFESEQKIRILNLMEQHNVDLRDYHDSVVDEKLEVPEWMTNLFKDCDFLSFELIDSDMLNVLYFMQVISL